AFQKGNKCKNVLNQVDLLVHKGETVGILGFSGCGKSTLAKCVTGLELPDQGRIVYNNQDISMLRGRKRQHVCKSLQIVFQDARASLNPRRSALELVQEPLKYLKIGTPKERTEKALLYLKSVGINGDVLHRCPPQLSTGQCQRVAIARALVVDPELLIFDEAISALDMILQKQILDLLLNLQKSIGFAYIMISHDVRVIRHSCERVAIMNNGIFVDMVSSDRLTAQSKNKFTRCLLDSELHIA
uniref:ABC transporter ATP-binding protein n=1 Tax=uncultured Olegusella sp. TaxID=1979846 RepID=UPI00262DE2D9